MNFLVEIKDYTENEDEAQLHIVINGETKKEVI